MTESIYRLRIWDPWFVLVTENEFGNDLDMLARKLRAERKGG
jgi:hypothetical protein